MAAVPAIVTILFVIFTLGSCQNDTNTTSIEQDFSGVEVSYELWLRAGCFMGSPRPSGRLTTILTSENGTRLAMIMRNVNSVSQLLVHDYLNRNIELSTRNKTSIETAANGEFLLYSAFKLNGSHMIASDLSGDEVAIRTDLQPTDIWNVKLIAFGADLLSCLPRIDCGR